MNKIIGILLVLLACACSSPAAKKAPLTIATAANMQFAMAAIAERFSVKYGRACELVISSSGKLTAQIQAGAPYDVLVSADRKYPEALQAAGLTANEPQIYAYGKLVLWSMTESVPSIERLREGEVQHLAMANPKTAPYGAAAVEVLQYYGLYKQLEKQLVFGESIAQTNQFILSGAADLGFTAQSVVLAPQLQGPGQWVAVDTAAYEPIVQAVVAIEREGVASEAALTFCAYLFSAEAQEILADFGY